jgi:hypothetical protein
MHAKNFFTCNFTMERVSTEILLEICFYLDLSDLKALLATCQSVYQRISASIHGTILNKIRSNQIYSNAALLKRIFTDPEFKKYWVDLPPYNSDHIYKFDRPNEFFGFLESSSGKRFASRQEGFYNSFILSPDIYDQEIADCLLLACSFGQKEVVQWVLSRPCFDVYCKAYKRQKALEIATTKNFVGIVSTLVQDGRFTSWNGYHESLHIAARNNNVKLVKIFLRENIIDPTYNSSFVLSWACQKGHSDIVQYLVGRFDFLNFAVNDNFCIQTAVERGHTEIVQQLLKAPHVDPSCNGNFCIQVACELGYLDIVRELLNDARVDPKTNSGYSLQQAQKNGHTEIVKLLKDRGVSRASDGITILRQNAPSHTINIAFNTGDEELYNRYFLGCAVPVQNVSEGLTFQLKDVYSLNPRKKYSAVSKKCENRLAFQVDFECHQDCNIQANQPLHSIQENSESSWYGVKILKVDFAADTTIACGFAHKNYSLSKLPGWGPSSFGYHGDDGKIHFEGMSDRHDTHPALYPGDVIKFYLEFGDSKCVNISIEINGVHVKEMLVDSMNMDDFHPTVGMFGSGSYEIFFQE